MNLAGFKKMKEDKKTVTMGHPSGHSITILKSKIPALQRKQLEKLPLHLAAGTDGPLDSNSSDDSSTTADQSVDNSVLAQPQDVSEQPVVDSSVVTPDANDKSSVVAPNQGGIAAIPPAVPVNADESAITPYAPNSVNRAPASVPEVAKAIPDSSDVLNSSYKMGQHAIREEQNVASQLAKSQADIQQQDLDARKALNQDIQNSSKVFQEGQQKLLDAYANGKIDPNHYQESMGTGRKVATAIGLLLGGISGGLNGTGVNPAAKFLQDQISRDIEAQKSSLDQKRTILGANRELYQDKQLAENATRMNMNDIYSHQIQLAASKIGTAQAKAAADAQSSKLGLENAQLLQSNSLRAATLKSIKSGGAGLDAITLANAGLMKPEEAQKEQSSIDAQKQAINNINSLYQQANKEQTAGNLLNPQSYKRIDQINASVRDQILSTDVSHRVSPEVLKSLVDPFLIKTGDDDQTRAQKQQGLLEKVKALNAGDTPLTARYAPQALPQYPTVKENQIGRSAPIKAGDIVYKNGQKAQVLPDGRLKAI